MCLTFAHGNAAFGIVCTDTRIRHVTGNSYIDAETDKKLVPLARGWATTRGDAVLGSAGLQALASAPREAGPEELGRAVREAWARFPAAELDPTDFLLLLAAENGFQALQIDAGGRVWPGRTLLGAPPAAGGEDGVAIRDRAAALFAPKLRAARTLGNYVRRVAEMFLWVAGQTDGSTDTINSGIMTLPSHGTVGSSRLLAPAARVAGATDGELEAMLQPARHECLS